MAHQHRILRPLAAPTIITGQGGDESTTLSRYISKVGQDRPAPDITLPLINRDASAEFVKPLDGRRQLGRVFSQHRTPADKRSHPTVFYVEFPADSSDFHEINGNTLVASIGDSAARGPFSRAEIAKVMELVRTDTDFLKLLKSCRPR